MNPQFLIRCFKYAQGFLVQELEKLKITFDSDEKKREMLLKCAETSLNSKLLSHYKEFFSEMVVSAVEKLDKNLLDKDLVGIK